VKAVERAITKNTIMIAGSAPNFPHGIIDNIADLAALAKKNGIPFHTDACLGGFYLPWARRFNSDIPSFDFAVDGVTSISVDTHKYGYATKGTSVILFKNEDLRRRMYHVVTEWPGGTYASPTIAGSRPGGLLACAWASLVACGQSGYYEKAQGIDQAAKTIKAGVRSIPGLELIGDSHSSVIAFTSKEMNIYKVNDQMSKHGYNLNALHRPNALHVCLTAQSIGRGAQFVQDLKESVAFVRANPKQEGGSAAIYGLASSFPDRAVVGDVAAIFLDVMSSM